MKNKFPIIYKNETIMVEADHKNTYTLKYPDFKFIELDRNEKGWIVEDRSGDYWSDDQIKELGDLIDQHEPVQEESEGGDENNSVSSLG